MTLGEQRAGYQVRSRVHGAQGFYTMTSLRTACQVIRFAEMTGHRGVTT